MRQSLQSNAASSVDRMDYRGYGSRWFGFGVRKTP